MPDPESPDDKKQRKKAGKTRKVWITFAGRVVAQVTGAIASVVLGLLVVQKYQDRRSGPGSTETVPPAQSTPRQATARRPGERSIVVLPLANLSQDTTQEYFADGMTEALTARLAQIRGLTVISRTSAMRYKTEQPSVPEIARALGVDLLVEGSVLQAGDQVRITAQLIDGATDEHLWAQSYTRRLRDIITLQDEVARAIGDEIQGTVSARSARADGARRPVDPQAYDLYLRGRHAWFQRSTDALQTAVDFFSRALAIDSEFALAYVGLADAYSMQGSPGRGLKDSADTTAKARAAALRAIELDQSLAEAHAAVGGTMFFADRDFAGAEAAFRKAIDLNPNYPVAHEWFAVLLSELGRDTEAIGHVDVAVKLSPLEGTMHQARGLVNYNARRFTQAVEAERRALELTPRLPLARTVLVKALTLGGRAPEAMSECAALSAARDDIDLAVACNVAALKAGRAADANRVHAQIEALRPSPDVAIAQLHAALGECPEAFARIERLAASGNLPPNLAFDPLFEGLRQQPEWARIGQRTGGRRE